MSTQAPDSFSASTDAANPPTNEAAPRKKGRGCLWAVLIVITLGVVGSLLCCGGGLYFGMEYSGLAYMDPVNQMPEVTNEIGTVRSLKVNLAATIDEFQEYPDHVVFDATGERGTTRLSIKAGSAGEIEAIYILGEDGSRTPIDLAAPLPIPAASP